MKNLLVALMLLANAAPSLGAEIDLMAYNVENLFDSLPSGKSDYEFLPKSSKLKEKCGAGKWATACRQTDWTLRRYQAKIARLKEVFELVREERGGLPDVVALTEVENESVVRDLANAIGYSSILVSDFSGDSPGRRGLDVALMFDPKGKQPKVQIDRGSAVLHHLTFSYQKGDKTKTKAMRPILEVDAKIGARPVTFYVNHWFSQGAPTSSRIEAAKLLKKLVERKIAADPARGIIATGDFNTTDRDHPSPFLVLPLVDVHSLAPSERTRSPGTYFFGSEMVWNRLDRFFVSRNLASKTNGLRVQPAGYQIFSPRALSMTFRYQKGSGLSGEDEFQSSDYFWGAVMPGVPRPYHFLKPELDGDSAAGVSDHFPVLMRLSVE